MKRAWQCTGIAFTIVFAAWAQQSWLLSLTDALGPGPGFFPFWLSMIGLALSIALVVRLQLLGYPAAETPAPSPGNTAPRKVVIVLGALTAAALLMETLGFRLVTAAFCLIVLPALGARSWPVIIAYAATASFGVYAVFSDLLKVPLPAGLFGP